MNLTLDESTVENDPVTQFAKWYNEAAEAGVPEPNAMNVATVGADLRPSSRVILLKDFGPDGFTFFTNYNSRKAHEIRQNPNCCFTFFWPQQGRQIRIEGKLQPVSRAVSDAYFLTRPRGSRVGAWASPQSEEIAGRKLLEDRLATAEDNFANKEVTRPEWWGGYVLVPDYFEFWQAGDSRLHDRVCYRKEAHGWKIARLAP